MYLFFSRELGQELCYNDTPTTKPDIKPLKIYLNIQYTLVDQFWRKK
jgi:hypothetical protein